MTSSPLLLALLVSDGDWVQQQDDNAGEDRQAAEQVRRVPRPGHVLQQSCTRARGHHAPVNASVLSLLPFYGGCKRDTARICC